MKVWQTIPLYIYPEEGHLYLRESIKDGGHAIQRELHKAIQQLPEKQKLVFNMRYFDDMKYEDIAVITGTSVGALKASYHHAYIKIKERLENIDF